MLDFSNMTIGTKRAKVKAQKRLSVPSNTEMLIWGRLPGHVLHGVQGLCSNSNELLKLGMLSAKAVVSVNAQKLVPVKIFNPTSSIVDIPKGHVIAMFESTDNDCYISKLDGHQVNHIQLNHQVLVDENSAFNTR